jgi:glycosyltransferase involved in cell wall biosynthesis
MIKINVLLYIDSLMVGGMHKQTLYLAKYLNKNIFNIVVLTQNTDQGGLREEFYSSGCTILDLGRNSLPSIKKPFNPLVAFQLLSVLKKENIDIVYLNAAPNLIYFLIARLFLFKKISQIGSFRALTFWKGNLNRKYKVLDNLFAQLLYITSKYTIVNSDALKYNYNKILRINDKNPLVVINNGCDFNFNITRSVNEIRHELNLQQNEYFVLMAARLDPWKDFNTLLESAKILKDYDLSIKIIIMGNGVLRNEIETSIKSAKLEDTILLIGEKVDSINYINACDISILSTHGEGFSNTILESMYLKKTVVATRVGGNIDMIGDSNNYGYLVQPKSALELAQKILFCKNNFPHTVQIGTNAHEKIIKMCNIKKYVEAYEDIFQKVNSHK